MRYWPSMIPVALIVSALGEVRDPFQALPDPCAAPFHAWRLHATVQSRGGNAVAIVAVPSGWLRLHSGDFPWPGWQVTEIAERRVYLQSQAHCPTVMLESAPQGERNDRKDPDSLRISVGRSGIGGSAR